jgi:MFS family permease
VVLTSGSVFWRWWTAGAISSVGSAVGGVALPLTALTLLHASAFEMGLIAAAGYLAWIVIGLPAGVIVQRLPLRGLQIGADLARATAIASVPLTWWWGHLTIVHLVAVALVISFGNVVFDVANSTFLPSIVPAEELTSRNSVSSAMHAGSDLGGPAAGGVLVQLLGPVATLLVDVASYVASAVLMRSLPRAAEQTPAQWPPMREMIREGWNFVVRHPIMGPCMGTATVVNFICGAQAALYPLYLVRTLDAPAWAIGLLLGAEGIGALLGAALTLQLTRRFGTARSLIIIGPFVVAGAALIPLGRGLAGFLAFAFGNIVFAGAVMVLSITTRTYRQVASPPELLSRVMATVRFVSWGAIPVGGLVAGGLAQLWGPRTAQVIFAVVSIGAPLTTLFTPVRRLRDLLDWDVQTRSEPAVLG